MGVDVEHHQNKNHALEATPLFLSKAELKSIDSEAPDRRGRNALSEWTIREAVIKGFGAGLSMPMRSVDVQADVQRHGARRAKVMGDDRIWSVMPLDLGEELVGHVAVPGMPRSVRILDWEGIESDSAASKLTTASP